MKNEESKYSIKLLCDFALHLHPIYRQILKHFISAKLAIMLSALFDALLTSIIKCTT